MSEANFTGCRGGDISLASLFENPRFSILSFNGKLPFPDPFLFSSPKIKNSCAAGETRTPNSVKKLVPKTSAYTNSATAAFVNCIDYFQKYQAKTAQKMRARISFIFCHRFSLSKRFFGDFRQKEKIFEQSCFMHVTVA